MNVIKVAAIPAVFALSACGGGSATSEFSPANVSILWESPRGTGAGLIRATSAEQNGVALVANVNDNNRRYSSFEIVEVISETRNVDGSVSGEIVIRDADGELSNVLGTFYDGEVGLYTRVTGGDAVIVAAGSRPQNLPIGSYSYSGLAESYYVYNGSDYSEVGRFDLDVQFGSGTAQLDARTTEASYVNNNLVVNSAGELAGTSGTFTVYDTDRTTVLDTRSVDFDGTFHGSGATHVSGIAVGGATTTDDFSIMGIVGKR